MMFWFIAHYQYKMTLSTFLTVSDILKKNQLLVKFSKYTFAQKSVGFVRHIICGGVVGLIQTLWDKSNEEVTCP